MRAERAVAQFVKAAENKHLSSELLGSLLRHENERSKLGLLKRDQGPDFLHKIFIKSLVVVVEKLDFDVENFDFPLEKLDFPVEYWIFL